MIRVLSVLVMIAFGAAAKAQELTIAGIGPEPKRISLADLATAGLIEVKDGREITVGGETRRIEIRYGGVPLPLLLQKAGIETLDRYGLRAASIVVIARDGYRASFSWGELFNTTGGDSVIVITQENGTANPAREGAFSLRAFADRRPGPRHVRDVAEIRVEVPPR